MGSIYGNRDRNNNDRAKQHSFNSSNDGNRSKKYNSDIKGKNEICRNNEKVRYDRIQGKASFGKNKMRQDSRGYHRNSGNTDRYGEGTRNNISIIENVRLRRFVFSAVVNLIVTAIMIVISCILIDGDYIDVYIKLLFLPISSFCGNFIVRFINNDIMMNMVASIVVSIIAFMIFVNVSWTMLFWALFYLVNGILGMLIATFAKRN